LVALALRRKAPAEIPVESISKQKIKNNNKNVTLDEHVWGEHTMIFDRAEPSRESVTGPLALPIRFLLPTPDSKGRRSTILCRKLPEKRDWARPHRQSASNNKERLLLSPRNRSRERDPRATTTTENTPPRGPPLSTLFLSLSLRLSYQSRVLVSVFRMIGTTNVNFPTKRQSHTQQLVSTRKGKKVDPLFIKVPQHHHLSRICRPRRIGN